jgi:SAM-dependent methyltransferase
MMFGSREEFDYLECSNCGCVQIVDIPASMSKYYPANYHSFAPISHPTRLRKWLTNVRDSHAVSDRGLLGKVLCRYFPPNIALRSLSHLGLDHGARILDVGCGSGMLLNAMGNLGFTRLVGTDPFLPADVEYANGVKLLKGGILEVAGEYDVIMFHHAFEHISDPEPTLKAVHQLLAPGGTCIIRVPTVSSYAWQHYGVNWVQLDAPRHFYVHSGQSVQMMANRAGLEVSSMVYDSSAFQFWASEQYALDIPLYDTRSYAVSPANSIFTKQQIAAFEKRAGELNKANLGDQAVFYLQSRNGA